MVEFNNEEMQGERRETFVIQADRFGEDSALNSVREKLRPLLKRGFAVFSDQSGGSLAAGRSSRLIHTGCKCKNEAQ